MKKLIAISALVSLAVVAVIHAADATFNYTGSQTITAVRSVTAKAPQLVTATNGPVTIAAMTNGLAGALVTRTLQNCGTNSVLYCLGGTVATTNYHGVIAGGSVIRDGLGSVLDISKWPGSVTVMTESGTSTVAVTELIH